MPPPKAADLCDAAQVKVVIGNEDLYWGHPSDGDDAPGSRHYTTARRSSRQQPAEAAPAAANAKTAAPLRPGGRGVSTRGRRERDSVGRGVRTRCLESFTSPLTPRRRAPPPALVALGALVRVLVPRRRLERHLSPRLGDERARAWRRRRPPIGDEDRDHLLLARQVRCRRARWLLVVRRQHFAHRVRRRLGEWRRRSAPSCHLQASPRSSNAFGGRSRSRRAEVRPCRHARIRRCARRSPAPAAGIAARR